MALARRALVVGASKSIGRAVVTELAYGWSDDSGISPEIIGVARSKQPEDWEGGQYIAVDLTRGYPSDWPKDFDIIVHALGGSRGMTDTWASSYDWQTVWRLNLGIAHDINCAFIPGMIKRGWGRIVHISSISTKAHIGYAPYQSAKAAVEGYVQAVGKELAPTGVVMTCVAPGAIWTDGRYFANLPEAERAEYIKNFIPAGRLGRAKEVAKVIAFLCSDAASYMAGAIVRVDGAGR